VSPAGGTGRLPGARPRRSWAVPWPFLGRPWSPVVAAA